jgi:XRE family aerobic/anaerobic benzoate catabolism transcriptional regulator
MGADAQAFLGRLGGHLRSLRTARGLAVAELARQGGISRRYLTEVEAGRTNPTVSVLLALARALGTDAAAVLAAVEAEPRGERIALLGLRGAGKSSVGRLLARELECPFVELDQRVEELAGLPLAELFDLRGPEAYPRFEAEALERVLAEGNRLVLATGGSLVTRARTFARLRATCRTVWLRAEPEEHFARVVRQGDHRPMHARPRAMEELRAILDEREALYARCELVQPTSGRTPEAVVRELRAALQPA